MLPADFSHAQTFLARLANIYNDDDVQQIVDALWETDSNTDQLLGASENAFWVNPLLAPFDVNFPQMRKVEGVDQVFALPLSANLAATAAATNGHVYIQNASSAYAVDVLDPQQDEEVLDLAAAPGGKTIRIAAKMANTGRVAAVEAVKGRFHRMRANLERCGVTNVQTYLRDGRGVGRVVGPRFDRVLLDAPCSSESHMRWREPKTYAQWSPRKVKECQRKQKGLIRSAWNALKPGGVLVYSTCSFSLEENELVIAYLLENADHNPTLVPIDKRLPHHRPGMTTGHKRLVPELRSCLRILPNRCWDGFFIAKLRKGHAP